MQSILFLLLHFEVNYLFILLYNEYLSFFTFDSLMWLVSYATNTTMMLWLQVSWQMPKYIQLWRVISLKEQCYSISLMKMECFIAVSAGALWCHKVVKCTCSISQKTNMRYGLRDLYHNKIIYLINTHLKQWHNSQLTFVSWYVKFRRNAIFSNYSIRINEIWKLIRISPMFHFYVPWKSQKNFFRGQRNKTLGWYGLSKR